MVDTTRIRNELGYEESVTLDAALNRTIAWQRTHPPERIDPEKFDYRKEDMVLTGIEHKEPG